MKGGPISHDIRVEGGGRWVWRKVGGWVDLFVSRTCCSLETHQHLPHPCLYILARVLTALLCRSRRCSLLLTTSGILKGLLRWPIFSHAAFTTRGPLIRLQDIGYPVYPTVRVCSSRDTTRRIWLNLCVLPDSTRIAYFRGRKLQGRTVTIPDHCRGVVVEREPRDQGEGPSARQEQDEDANGKELGALQVTDRFEKLVMWSHGASANSAPDPYLRGICEWLQVAPKVSILDRKQCYGIMFLAPELTICKIHSFPERKSQDRRGNVAS